MFMFSLKNLVRKVLNNDVPDYLTSELSCIDEVIQT